MSHYFSIYVAVLSQVFGKMRKVGFKKGSPLKEIMNQLQTTLQKESHGRIEPGSYLMFLLLSLGTKNPKIYLHAIQAIQKMLSHNFINHNESLAGVLKLTPELKEATKELLLLQPEDYETKNFKELYVESLINLTDRDDPLTLLVVKNFSLIWRIAQNSLSNNNITKMLQYIVEAIIGNKTQEYDKILKSAFLEVVRHSVQSYKESTDQKYLHNDNVPSIRQQCRLYGQIIADQAAIRATIQAQQGTKEYQVIPNNPEEIRLVAFSIPNESGSQSGKFGWCIMCRKQANYYCRINRVPVCSYKCKDAYDSNSSTIYNISELLQRLLIDEDNFSRIFADHLVLICKLTVKYLTHTDVRRRLSFTDVFSHICSQIKKLSSCLTGSLKQQLQAMIKHTILNIQNETEALPSCLNCIKKLLHLRIFLNQIEILFGFIAQKLTFYLTPTPIKEELLRFCKDFVNSPYFFDCFIELDCNPTRNDSLLQLLTAVYRVYLGIDTPENVIVPPQQPSVRKAAYQIANLLLKNLQALNKVEETNTLEKIMACKKQKNRIRNIIKRFNESQKPLKVIKKLIIEKELPDQAPEIAEFLHRELSKLNFTNVGTLIGDIDPFACGIRDNFIKKMNFEKLAADEALRLLLSHFTLPGQSQVVERIIDSFSISYFAQNKQEAFSHSDSVYSFCYLLMMLQTNLHNPQVIEKMTIEQFADLSKGMNGPTANYPGTPNKDYPMDFLESIYHSIEKKQLAIHEKMKDVQISTAYSINPRKALELNQTYLIQEGKKAFAKIKGMAPETIGVHRNYPIGILAGQLVPGIIDVLTKKITELDEKQSKQEIFRILECMEEAVRFGCEKGETHLVEKALEGLWAQITRIATLKKYILMEQYLSWAKKFSHHLYSQWSTLIYLLSKFYRSKLIKKQAPSSKKYCLLQLNDKCYIYESYIDSLFAKSSTYSEKSLKKLVQALIEVSKQEISESCHPFCLDKIGQILQFNSSRSPLLLPVLWPDLKEYYIELGKSKSERISLFGTDFLKQIVTKFLKKKELTPYQKDYMKPFEDIFLSTRLFGVKEYIIGGVGYFINNHSPALKSGWKIVFAVLGAVFEEEEVPKLKEQAFFIVRRIEEDNFKILPIEEYYQDFVQILNKLARQKAIIFPKGCLEAVGKVIYYYHTAKSINLENPRVESNKSLDNHFWQTIWLPLLSAIYGICGDSRIEVQMEAIQMLFSILMKYGCLFEKEFWMMVLQGVLRPTFQEIIYTSQSKAMGKEQLEQWSRNSFMVLFESISELIYKYFVDFRLFLPEVLKIYESSIIYFSNKLLIKLSITALSDLLHKIGPQFVIEDWLKFTIFIENLFRKTMPMEVTSQELWKLRDQATENPCQGKYIALHLCIVKIEEVVEKFSSQIDETICLQILFQINKIYQFTSCFNRNIVLRLTLWKNGFYSNMKSLPGLLKHEHQALKFITNLRFLLSQKNSENYKQCFNHIFKIFDSYKQLAIRNPIRNRTVEIEERQREFTMLQLLIIDVILPHLKVITIDKIMKLGYGPQLFQHLLEMVNQKCFCSKCTFCESCENNVVRYNQLNGELKNMIKELFDKRGS